MQDIYKKVYNKPRNKIKDNETAICSLKSYGKIMIEEQKILDKEADNGEVNIQSYR